MAYKRYVHKKGKRHGPYYYKNVRDESGKVRSIYLGKVTSRGKRSLEVAIVFLTALLIIISALFFIQNRNLVLSKIAAEEAKVPFEVDQILIKVLVKEKEYIEKELRVMNVEGREQTIQIASAEISHLVNVLDREFTIKPGQTKIVRLNFSSFDSKNKIEQAPGVYIGKVIAKTDSYGKEVPVVVEIESKNVLFDMNLNPIARDRTVTQGSSTTFEIRVFNLQSIESFNVGMDFFVKDINGNTIISERESVVVQTQASFFKTLKIPERLKAGNYVFVAQASLGNSVGTASYLFDVEEVAEERQFSRFLAFCRNDPLCWALSIIVLLLLFAIGAYSYFFIGVFIYKRLFGISMPREKKVTLDYEKRGKNVVIKSFEDIAAWWRKTKETSLREKLKEDELKLQIKEKERKLRDGSKLSEESGRLVEKCRKLIEKGYKAMENNNIGKAQKAYAELMDNYIDLPGKIKVEVFKDINSFYKNMLLKKPQLKQYYIESRKKAEEEKQRIELEKKGQRELKETRKLAEKERKLKLREEFSKKRKQRIFDFFHGIGLVKTEQEKQGIARRKEEKRKIRERIFQKSLEEKGRKAEEKFKTPLEEYMREQKPLEGKKQQKERERQKALEEKRKQEEQEKKEEEQRRREEEGRKKEEERKKAKEERERQKLEEKRKEEEERKKELEERRKQQEEKRQEEEREKEEAQKKKEEGRKQREAERAWKQKENAIKAKKIQSLSNLIEEKESNIRKLKDKISEAYSENKKLAKEISYIGKDVEGIKNEKKTMYDMYNDGIGGKKELAKEHESKIAEWKERHDAKLKEKSDIKKEIRQEYENELKELESELGTLSDKERKEEEKWKKLELKAKYKLEEHEREKSVNEELKSQLEEKRELELEYSKKKQSMGKGIAGREILQKQKELNDHIREHEKDISKLKEKISSNEKALGTYENEIEKLGKEKEKAQERLLEAKKEAGGLSYIASIFMPKAKKEEKPVKQIVKEKPQKKTEKVKDEIADFGKEITKENIEQEEAKDLEEEKELQSTLKRLQITTKEIEHKENIIEKLAKEKDGKRRKTKEEKKPGILYNLFKGAGAKAKEPEQIKGKKEKLEEQRKKEGLERKKIEEKEYIEIERKLEGKSRLFRKCHGMMLNANNALMGNDTGMAKKLYLKTREIYINLEYHEKKELYDELMDLYNKLKQ